MDRIKNYSILRLIYSVAINVAVICLALFVFIPFFEEIDDTHIAMLSEGAYGLREWRLIYVNVILGRIYYLFNNLFPVFRWHTVIQFFFIFWGYVSATYVISKHKYGYILSFAAITGTFYELYVSVQYTKTAAFVTAVGVMLLFEYVRDNVYISKIDSMAHASDKKGLSVEKNIFVVAGFIMIAYGAMLRFEACIIACIPLFFVGLLEISRTRRILDYLKVFLPIGLIVLTCFIVNKVSYAKDPEWNDFMRYNQARMQLTDYRYDILYYPHNGDKLTEMGITENDALSIVTFQFADDHIYDTEYMENITETFGRKPFNFRVFRNLYGSVREELSKNTVEIPALIGFITLLIVTIIVERSRSHSQSIADSNRKLTAMIFMGALCASALIYYQYSGRWNHRLVGALIIPTIYAICYMLDGGISFGNDGNIVFGGNFRDYSRQLIVLIILISVGINLQSYKKNTERFKENANEYYAGKQELNDISEDKEKLYVFDTFTFQYNFVYDVFTPNKEGEYSNFVSCGSWFMNSPVTKSQVRKFGYENSYDALRLNKGDACLIDNCFPGEKALFFSEHYGDNYKARQIGSQNGFDYYIMEIEND